MCIHLYYYFGGARFFKKAYTILEKWFCVLQYIKQMRKSNLLLFRVPSAQFQHLAHKIEEVKVEIFGTIKILPLLLQNVSKVTLHLYNAPYIFANPLKP